MSKHTPGPWRQAQLPLSATIVETPSGKVIARAQMFESHPGNWDEAFANARLIAAAPELLKALEDIVDCQADTYGNATHLHVAMIGLAASARATIAKAAGEANSVPEDNTP